MLRALLAGKAPDGGVLVRQVLRADARGRLEASPLVDAVQARADRRVVPVEALFAEPNDRARYATLATREARPGSAAGHRRLTRDALRGSLKRRAST